MRKKLNIKIHGILDLNEFVQKARFVDGDVLVSRGRICVDGKSIMGVFSIDVSCGCTVEYPETATDFEAYIMKFKSE